MDKLVLRLATDNKALMGAILGKTNVIPSGENDARGGAE